MEHFLAEAVVAPSKFGDSRVADSIIMREFVKKDARQLAEKMTDPRPLMEYLYQFILTHDRKPRDFNIATEACKTLATLHAPLELRREYALKLFENYSVKGYIPNEVAALVDDAMLPRLRERLRRSIGKPDVFPITLARHLVDRDDFESLPILADAEKSLFPAEYLDGRKLTDFPISLTWRLAVQHPPADLLKWLPKGPTPATEAGHIDQDTRMWMIRRAVEIGLDREQIRQAVLQYADLYQKAGRPFTMELPSVKRFAIDAGVLRQNDLPTVAQIDPSAKRDRAR